MVFGGSAALLKHNLQTTISNKNDGSTKGLATVSVVGEFCVDGNTNSVDRRYPHMDTFENHNEDEYDELEG